MLKNSGNLKSGSYGTITGTYAMNFGVYMPSCVDAAKGTTFDEVRIYNRALSAAEISAVYNATK